MKNKLALFLLAVLMLGCGLSSASAETTAYNVEEIAPYVDRVVDEEFGVVCWLFNKEGYVGGISCLPLE
jgi:hypothetical protein